MLDKNDSNKTSSETAKCSGLHKKVKSSHRVALVNTMSITTRANFARIGVTLSTGRQEDGC